MIKLNNKREFFHSLYPSLKVEFNHMVSGPLFFENLQRAYFESEVAK